MKKKELYRICHANGIPPLLYKWSLFQEMEESRLKNKLLPVFDEVEIFIQERYVWYIHMEDSLLASRIGVAFFKAALLKGFVGTRYTTLENICSYRRENWYEDGDVYTTLLNSDFLIIDKVRHKMEDWQRKIWDEFTEDRLLKDRATVFVGLVSHTKQGVFNERSIDILKSIGTKLLNENGISSVC